MNIKKTFNNPIFVSIFTAIASDPTLPDSWNRLYSNLYFRFLVLFIIIYQTNISIKRTLVTTILTMFFFYFISSKKEREVNFHIIKTLKDFKNRIEDFKIFIYLIIFLIGSLKIDNLLK